VIPIGKEENTI